MITVLSIDIVGSVEKGLTIEDIQGFVSEVGPLVPKSGGKIEKLTGDGLIAYWDPPNIDMAEGCAISMRALSPYPVRIGIHDGEGQVGFLGFEDVSHLAIIGECIIVANALRKIARPGWITIGDPSGGRVQRIKGKDFSYREV